MEHARVYALQDYGGAKNNTNFGTVVHYFLEDARTITIHVYTYHILCIRSRIYIIHIHMNFHMNLNLICV